jgi:hypothetical protein
MSSSSMLPVDESRLLIGQKAFDGGGSWPIIALGSFAAGDVHSWASETNEFSYRNLCCAEKQKIGTLTVN